MCGQEGASSAMLHCSMIAQERQGKKDREKFAASQQFTFGPAATLKSKMECRHSSNSLDRDLNFGIYIR
jgi:uncharacterized membrane protein